MNYQPALIPATLVRRYKRFLADVVTEKGETLTIHTSNTGSMLGCAEPGSRVWIRDSGNPERKYPWTWELATTESGSLVGVNTHLANSLVSEAIDNHIVSEFADITAVRKEVRYGNENSRIDLLLEQGMEHRQIYVEVKNVTASLQTGIACFPDAVTARGTRHLRELARMVEEGHRAVIFFCVPREDIQQVRPADAIDSLYGETLREVLAKGVEAMAYGARITSSEIILNKCLPVVCP